MGEAKLGEDAFIETERRFLVLEADARVYRRFRKEEIEQGWPIAEDGDCLRVRIVNGERVTVERKVGHGMHRKETPLPGNMSLAQGRFLLDACPLVVRKTRYVAENGWHIEELHGRFEGDLIAEYEGADAARANLPPYIPRAVEVTDTLNALTIARFARFAPPGAHIGDFLKVLDLPRISIEGGPGSGKSDLVRYIEDNRADLFVLHETPRMLFAHSGMKQKLDGGELYDIATQQAIFGSQRALEGACSVHAALIGCRGIVFDRGTPGGIGYLDRALWEAACGTTIEAEHRRYGFVVVMDMPSRHIYEANARRAAEGKSDVRIEDYDLARSRHDGSVAAWLGHPNVVRIPASETWNEKLTLALAAIDAYLDTRT